MTRQIDFTKLDQLVNKFKANLQSQAALLNSDGEDLTRFTTEMLEQVQRQYMEISKAVSKLAATSEHEANRAYQISKQFEQKMGRIMEVFEAPFVSYQVNSLHDLLTIAERLGQMTDIQFNRLCDLAMAMRENKS